MNISTGANSVTVLAVHRGRLLAMLAHICNSFFFLSLWLVTKANAWRMFLIIASSRIITRAYIKKYRLPANVSFVYMR